MTLTDRQSSPPTCVASTDHSVRSFRALRKSGPDSKPSSVVSKGQNLKASPTTAKPGVAVPSAFSIRSTVALVLIRDVGTVSPVWERKMSSQMTASVGGNTAAKIYALVELTSRVIPSPRKYRCSELSQKNTALAANLKRTAFLRSIRAPT